jgi:hypothetical protein
MEGLFGQGKSQHGLERARLRGLMKMQMQALLTAMVLNVKKLLLAVFGGKTVAYGEARVFGKFLLMRVFWLFQVQRLRFYLDGTRNLVFQGNMK